MRRSRVKRPRLERLQLLPNNSMQRTSLRAAAEPGRWAALGAISENPLAYLLALC